MRRRMECWGSNEQGLTLVELAIVVLIIGILTGLTVPAVSNITRASLRTSASKLAGSIRFAYDLSARKNLPFRMVFNIDERSYWIETTQENFLLDRKKSEVRDGAVTSEGNEEHAKRFVSRNFIENGDMWKPKGPPPFSKFAGALTPKVILSDGISFRDIWVAHQTERATTGAVYTYFFPTGLTEKTVIHLSDDDDNTYTLLVEPLSGRVRIYPQYFDVSED
jgi:prepilin-type N-terminal cleavage/methylation domain-containing protein